MCLEVEDDLRVEEGDQRTWIFGVFFLFVRLERFLVVWVLESKKGGQDRFKGEIRAKRGSSKTTKWLKISVMFEFFVFEI